MRRKILFTFLGLSVLAVGVLGWRHWSYRHPSGPKSVRLEIPITPPAPENILATYENTFRCTLYYCPRETGFTKEGGFDMEGDSRSGLQDHHYAKDFLRAVEMEGFGRLKEAVDGNAYLRYWNKQWGFAEVPVDNHQRPLIPKHSCAVSKDFALVKADALLRIRCDAAPFHFNELRWKVSDTGSGLREKQLDLYWGEDDPLGPGKRLTQPKGLNVDLINPTVLVVEAGR